MKTTKILWLGLLGVLVFVGCSDDSVGPDQNTIIEKISGEWECVRFIIDGEDRPITDNNIFWYFNESGEFCSQWMTAYGTYYTGSDGQVSSENSLLNETYIQGNELQWELLLASQGDTLRSYVVSPDSLSGREWVFIQTQDGPESSCF